MSTPDKKTINIVEEAINAIVYPSGGEYRTYNYKVYDIWHGYRASAADKNESQEWKDNARKLFLSDIEGGYTVLTVSWGYEYEKRVDGQSSHGSFLNNYEFKWDQRKGFIDAFDRSLKDVFNISDEYNTQIILAFKEEIKELKEAKTLVNMLNEIASEDREAEQNLSNTNRM